MVSQWLEVERFLEKRPSVDVAEPGPRWPECARESGWRSISRTPRQVDRFNLVAELSRDPLRVVAV